MQKRKTNLFGSWFQNSFRPARGFNRRVRISESRNSERIESSTRGIWSVDDFWGSSIVAECAETYFFQNNKIYQRRDPTGVRFSPIIIISLLRPRSQSVIKKNNNNKIHIRRCSILMTLFYDGEKKKKKKHLNG